MSQNCFIIVSNKLDNYLDDLVIENCQQQSVAEYAEANFIAICIRKLLEQIRFFAARRTPAGAQTNIHSAYKAISYLCAARNLVKPKRELAY